jgi:hypothetical protein
MPPGALKTESFNALIRHRYFATVRINIEREGGAMARWKKTFSDHNLGQACVRARMIANQQPDPDRR